MQFARENLILRGTLQRQKAINPRYPEDYIWRGSTTITFSNEFINWQRDGSPAIVIQSIFVHDLPSHSGYYTVTAESACVVSEVHKSHFTNKQLYFGSGPVEDPYPALRTTNAFSTPVSLSSPQTAFHLVVDVSPVYQSTLTADHEEAATVAAAITLPKFEACVSFLRVS